MSLAADSDLDRLLARPLSPGSVALLVERGQERAVWDRWAEALRDRRPETRGTAARAIHVSGALLREAVEKALEQESDPGWRR